MKPVAPIRRVTLILLIVILLPVLFFSAYQISTLSESERLMSDMYSRQLETVLYSVNQYALDVVHSWVSSVIPLIPPGTMHPGGNERADLRAWCDRTPSAIAVLLTDSTLRHADLVAKTGDLPVVVDERLVLGSLRGNRDKVGRLEEYRRVGYRKLEPFVLADTGNAARAIVLVFAVGDGSAARVGGLILDETVFIRDILIRKLQDAAGDEFVLGVVRDGDPDPVAVTSRVRTDDLKQRKELWVLPGYALGIRLKGATIEDVVSARVTKNIALVILLDFLLAAGIGLLYWSVRKEMQLARIKSDFVSNVSHELRTPLALIRMYAETLEMGRLKDDAKKAEYITTILRESERLTRLVNNILDFSRMQAGKKQYQFAQVQVNEAVTNVLNTYSVHLRAKGFTPVAELAPGLPTVRADAEALAEALINIIDNAVKYSEVNRYLAVRTGSADGWVTVEIEDHGIGISPSDQKRVFDMFYRVATGHVHDRKGTGIGLSLVKHIMDAHGGRVSVKSTVGEGSTFRLEFPVDRTNA